MKKKYQKTDHLDAEAATSGLREAITSADATGLIGGEELITEVETALPVLPNEFSKDRTKSGVVEKTVQSESIRANHARAEIWRAPV